MKRIAMISMHQCPLSYLEGEETGGTCVYVLELSKHLAKKGLKVDVFTRQRRDRTEKIIQVEENFRVIHLWGGNFDLHRKDLVPYTKDFANNIFEFICKNKIDYDLIHAHYFLAGLSALHLNKFLKHKIPLIMSFHTLALLKNLAVRGSFLREDLERINSEKLLVKESDKIIVSGKNDKNYLQSLYQTRENKIEIIEPGIDETIFKPIGKSKTRKIIGINKEQKVILFAGRIEPLKGIDVLLYAYKILLSKNPKLSFLLLIVGGTKNDKSFVDSELIRLKELVKLLGLEKYVRFEDQKTQEELANYYNASDLTVLSSYYESFGMTALESMACGTPSIITDVCGISSIFKESSFYRRLIIPSNNPLALAEKMEEILLDESVIKLKEEIYKNAQNFTWKDTAEEVEKIYGRILF